MGNLALYLSNERSQETNGLESCDVNVGYQVPGGFEIFSLMVPSFVDASLLKKTEKGMFLPHTHSPLHSLGNSHPIFPPSFEQLYKKHPFDYSSIHLSQIQQPSYPNYPEHPQFPSSHPNRPIPKNPPKTSLPYAPFRLILATNPRYNHYKPFQNPVQPPPPLLLHRTLVPQIQFRPWHWHWHWQAGLVGKVFKGRVKRGRGGWWGWWGWADWRLLLLLLLLLFCDPKC